MSELAVGSLAGLAANSYVIDVASGSQLTQPGMVLQVVSTTVTTQFTTNSGTFVDVTDMSLAITPTSATNKVFVLFDSQLGATGYFGVAQILRNGTAVGGGAGGYGMIPQATNGATDASMFAFLDSPASVSEQTYKLQIRVETAGGGRDVTCNRRNASTTPAVSSRITLMEVAA